MSMSVDSAAGSLRFGEPHVFFPGLRRSAGTVAMSRPLAVSKDGSKIVRIQGAEPPEPNVIHVKIGFR